MNDYVRALIQSVRPVFHARPHRLWEVDALRGFAIVIMVIYHFVWDLYGLAGWPIDMYGPFWRTWQRITATLFIGLVGVSLHLRYQRMRERGSVSARPTYLRAAVILTWAMGISVTTYLFQPQAYIRFGILHFIGVAILLAWILVRFTWLNLVVGISLLFLPYISWRHNITWLEWVGLIKAPHLAFDYFPLIPWLGVVLLGIFLGHIFFPQGKRRISLAPRAPSTLRWLQLAGQNALLLYLIHQPVMITLLVVAGIIPLR